MELMACSLCGTEFDSRRRVCPRCGEARNGTGAASPGGAAPGGAPGRTRALVLIGVLAAVVVAAVIALPKRQPTVSPGPPAPARVERAAPVDAPLPVVDPESVPPAERAFLDEVALGQIAFDEGRFEDALSEFVKAFDRDPRNAHAANAAGQALVRLGRPGDAVAYLEKASALAPDRADFHFNLARALGQGGRWGDAVAEYRKSADLRPDHYPSIFNLAQALERSGDAESALTEYQRGTTVAPLEPSFRLAAAVLADRLGRTDESRRFFEEYLELVPQGGESERVRQRLARLTATNSASEAASAAPPTVQR
jgi:tetratricopeptide (TPR) repeat protein